ncbi:hypothetical protein J7J90_02205 [Candidatus Micrarchaeota archaeon]|nr:hypothetical protein [Candidatus Micrarchaeota archaeon]
MGSFDKVLEIFKTAAYILKDNYKKYLYVGGIALILYFLISIISIILYYVAYLGGAFGANVLGAKEETAQFASIGITYGMMFILSFILGPMFSILYVRAREISWSLIAEKEIPFELGNVAVKGIVIWFIELILNLIIALPFSLAILGFFGSMFPVLSEYTQALAPMSFIFIVLGFLTIPVYIILSLLLAFMANEYVLTKLSIFESIKESASLVMRRFVDVMIFFILLIIVYIAVSIVFVGITLAVSILTCCLLCFGSIIQAIVRYGLMLILVFWTLTVNILFWRWLKEGK